MKSCGSEVKISCRFCLKLKFDLYQTGTSYFELLRSPKKKKKKKRCGMMFYINFSFNLELHLKLRTKLGYQGHMGTDIIGAPLRWGCLSKINGISIEFSKKSPSPLDYRLERVIDGGFKHGDVINNRDIRGLKQEICVLTSSCWNSKGFECFYGILFHVCL